MDDNARSLRRFVEENNDEAFNARVRHCAAVTASVVIAFGVGVFVGTRRTELPASSASPAPMNTAAFLEEMRRLATDVQRLSSELEALKADNLRLQAARANRRPVRARQVFGTPL